MKYSFKLLGEKKINFAYLLSTEVYKNTNQQFQEKYKKKAKVCNKDHYSSKKIWKMQLLFCKVNRADSAAKPSHVFSHRCGQKHISHYL